MNIQVIADWVVSNFCSYSTHINTIGIFGSVARFSKRPNDCDLLIVAVADVESEPWLFLRQHISSMKIDFLEKFGLPLNVTLLTVGEWNENRLFFRDLLQIEI